MKFRTILYEISQKRVQEIEAEDKHEAYLKALENLPNSFIEECGKGNIIVKAFKIEEED